MDERLYFAYGSNINRDQMAVRCPAATPVCPVALDNYRLTFRGNLGMSGVATILPAQGEKVYGLLWKITPACELSLDRYEGYPRLYGKEQVVVRDRDGQRYSVMVYTMARELYLDPAEPSPSYFSGIVQGCKQNDIPVRPLFEAAKRTRIEAEQTERPAWYPLHYGNITKSRHKKKNGPKR
jgi:gamma-glutamylcyclotransferase (GGCT)/AIG2-like uncharacterized protein YtfP